MHFRNTIHAEGYTQSRVICSCAYNTGRHLNSMYWVTSDQCSNRTETALADFIVNPWPADFIQVVIVHMLLQEQILDRSLF
jgi:hypothetical protein